jgi:uncharacterized protein (TIGR00251 family)
MKAVLKTIESRDLLGWYMKVHETRNGLILEISVKPNSQEFRITVEGDDIVVYCTEEPARGKVNRELIKQLSRVFHWKVELVSGFTSKQKRLLLRGARKSEIEKLLTSK